jgi:DnaJ-class molecular chaperone
MTTKSTNLYMQTYVVDTKSKQIVAMSDLSNVDPALLKKDAKKSRQPKPKKGAPSEMDRMQAKLYNNILYGIVDGAGQGSSDGKTTCTGCNGEGRHHHSTERDMKACTKCIDNVCMLCNGTGRMTAGIVDGIGSAAKKFMEQNNITFEKLEEEMLKGR